MGTILTVSHSAGNADLCIADCVLRSSRAEIQEIALQERVNQQRLDCE
jgi:hypothetical protein